MDRFIEKVLKQPNGCWLWTAANHIANQKVGDRYGRFNLAGRTIYAHRAAFVLFKGEIADGLTVDHLCKNTLCVNPDHLEAVSQRENNLRGKGFYAQHARKLVCKRGHQFDGTKTKADGRQYRHCSQCERIRSREHYRKKVA